MSDLGGEDHPGPLLVVLGCPARPANEVLDGLLVRLGEEASGGDDLPGEGGRRAREVDEVHVAPGCSRQPVHQDEAVEVEGRLAENGQIDVRLRARFAAGERAEEPHARDSPRLDQRVREEAIDERSASAVQERIEEILERPRDAWYEHATLEAAGTLREQTAAELAALARNLAAAEQAAADLAAAPSGAASAEKQRDSQALAAAARQLALGGMRPAGDAGEKLGKEAAEALADLSPEQLRELAAALRANRSKLKAALAKAANFDLAALGPESDCEGCKPCGTCKECREGKPCKKGACAACSRAGRGGITRGPGEAPMKAGTEEDLGATRRELVTAPTDIERSAAGELLDVVDAEHAVDESAYAGPQAGGNIAPSADGGGPSRVDNLLPREQDAVRRFFK